MAIRLRNITDVGTVALCAARSVERPGDVYLDDAQHYALAEKFWLDHPRCGISPRPEIAAVIDREESNNANRTEWDVVYGASTAAEESPPSLLPDDTPAPICEVCGSRATDIIATSTGWRCFDVYACARRERAASPLPETTPVDPPIGKLCRGCGRALKSCPTSEPETLALVCYNTNCTDLHVELWRASASVPSPTPIGEGGSEGVDSDARRLNELDALLAVDGEDVSLLGTSRGGVLLSTEKYPHVRGFPNGIRSTLDELTTLRAGGRPS